MALAKAPLLKGVSALMPSTVALASLSSLRLSWKVHISFVQTPVKAAGKKARTTFLPRSEDRLMASREVLGRVKSGADLPIRLI